MITRSLPSDRRTPLVYVALGDSTVEGEGASRQDASYVGRLYARLRSIYPAARMINLGIGGATSTDVAIALSGIVSRGAVTCGRRQSLTMLSTRTR